MKSVQGKTALVTGAAGGIGLGIAKQLLSAGMNVVITDINESLLASAEKDLKKDWANMLVCKMDSTDVDSIHQVSKKLHKTFGPLHLLCNNAGIGGGRKILETDSKKWREVFEVNFFGPLNGINAFLPSMLEHGEEGHIVNTASFSGIEGHGNQGAYGSSKFGLVGLSEFLRNDLLDTNIGVSVLCPHIVDTPILNNLKRRVGPETAEAIAKIAVAPEKVGHQVLNAVLNGEFYIFCDGTQTRAMLTTRCKNLLSAMNRQFPETP